MSLADYFGHAGPFFEENLYERISISHLFCLGAALAFT